MNELDSRSSAQPAAELRLEPLAASVRRARQFLRAQLAAAGHESWSDTAELALSEIVTNGVLHAHTELVVSVLVLPDAVHVEVRDANAALPVQRRGHGADATTGRGLELVAALTRDCGVRPESGGKVVWFEVGDPAEEVEASAEDLLAAWDVDGAWDADGWTPPPALDVHDVVLVGMPTTLWLAAREHHEALLRELVLYTAEHAAAMTTVPDLRAADEARQLIWTRLVEEIDRARQAGATRRSLPAGHPSPLPDVPSSIDLLLQVPTSMAPHFGALQDALDVCERLAEADLLLVRPGLPEIVAVRDWACEQVVAQLAGVPASPWGGSDQSRFVEQVHDRDDPATPGWDTDSVTKSDRGVVAADDANRIIAVSEPLARATGWDPAELVGRRVVALIPPSLREAHVAGFSRHLTTGEAHVLGVALTLPVLHRDGREIPSSFLVERASETTGRPVYLAWIEPLEA